MNLESNVNKWLEIDNSIKQLTEELKLYEMKNLILKKILWSMLIEIILIIFPLKQTKDIKVNSN